MAANKNVLVTGVFYYPGYIDLPNDKWFTIQFEGYPFAFTVLEHLSPVHCIGFNNQIEDNFTIEFRNDNKNQTTITYTTASTDNKQKSETNKAILKYETNEIAFSRYYTKLLLCNKGELNGETLRNNPKFREKLDEIIKIYRIASSDYRIPLDNEIRSEYPLGIIGYKDLSDDEIKFDLPELLTQIDEISFKTLNYQLKTLDRFESSPLTTGLPSEKIDENFEKLLAMKPSVINSNYIDGIGLAVRALVNENYKFAFLEIFMLLEIIVGDFLRHKKIEKGVSKKKLDNFSKDLRFSYMLNVEVPIFLNSISEKERELIGKIDKIRVKRNEIIHNGAIVNEDEAKNAISLCQEFTQLLDLNDEQERRRTHFSL